MAEQRPGKIRRSLGYLVSPRLFASAETTRRYGGLSFHAHRQLISVISAAIQAIKASKLKNKERSEEDGSQVQVLQSFDERLRYFYDYVYEWGYTETEIIGAHKNHVAQGRVGILSITVSIVFALVFLLFDNFTIIPNTVLALVSMAFACAVGLRSMSEFYLAWLIEQRLQPKHYSFMKYIRGLKSNFPARELSIEQITEMQREYFKRHVYLVERSKQPDVNPHVEGWAHLLRRAESELRQK